MALRTDEHGEAWAMVSHKSQTQFFHMPHPTRRKNDEGNEGTSHASGLGVGESNEPARADIISTPKAQPQSDDVHVSAPLQSSTPHVDKIFTPPAPPPHIDVQNSDYLYKDYRRVFIEEVYVENVIRVLSFTKNTPLCNTPNHQMQKKQLVSENRQVPEDLLFPQTQPPKNQRGRVNKVELVATLHHERLR
uniref:Uncharacterized protein n=1 Tax=Cannabis sativa TaxID=3483 RepID=A0A803QEQ1_CANSA